MMSGASEPCADKQSAAAFSRPAAAPSKEPKICANPSSHVISQPSISSTACQVLVLVHWPTISILGPDGPSYPAAYPPCLLISRPWFPMLCILWHLVYPQTLLKYVLNPQIFCPHSADTTYSLTADNLGCQCLRFTTPTPDLTTCTGETDITPNSRPAPHSETRHPGFDHHEGLA